jgi:hypothetical protein
MWRGGNKLHGWLRRRFAEEIGRRSKGRKASEETRRKQSEARLGKKPGPHSDETKLKMSKASKGRKKSEEHRKALSKAKTGKKVKRTAEHNEKIRQSNIRAAKLKDFSFMQNENYKQGQSEKMREIWAKRKAGKLPMPNHKES